MATNNGAKVNIEKGKQRLMNEDGQTIAIGKDDDQMDLIVMDFKVIKPEKAMFMIHPQEKLSMKQFDVRMGRLNERDLKRILNNDKMKGNQVKSNTKVGHCSTCIKGKMKTENFGQSETRKRSKCLELIHMDLVGRTENPNKRRMPTDNATGG
jgi:hypothetical protein